MQKEKGGDINITNVYGDNSTVAQGNQMRDFRMEKKEEDGEIKEIKAKYGMENATDEDFWLNFFQIGDELKKIRAAGPPRTYYTGKEPLAVLLRELSKEKDISRLHLKRGNSFFDFRQK